ncbi:hypothetical protein CcaCcLH18_12357 [Colletotrichum camelliae]|nr:hypothetical protein CcaCcLH18_12357 [Colletotrichum camelliae]
MDMDSLTKAFALAWSEDRKRKRASEPDVAFAKRPKLEECFPRLSFLSLPPEIRNMIYRHLGLFPTHCIEVEGRGVDVHYEHTFDFQLQRHSFRRALHPYSRQFHTAIVSTCKTIHQETRALVYGTIFFLSRMEDAASWLLNIGPQNRAMLRGIELMTRVKDIDTVSSFDDVETTNRARYRQVSKLDLFNPGTPPILACAQNSEEWINEAYKIAENLYMDFQPFFAEALARGRRPSRLCDIFDINREIFEDKEWMSLETQDYCLDDSQVSDAMAAFRDHLEWLLELHSKGLGRPSSGHASLSSIKVGVNICRHVVP